MELGRDVLRIEDSHRQTSFGGKEMNKAPLCPFCRTGLWLDSTAEEADGAEVYCGGCRAGWSRSQAIHSMATVVEGISLDIRTIIESMEEEANENQIEEDPFTEEEKQETVKAFSDLVDAYEKDANERKDKAEKVIERLQKERRDFSSGFDSNDDNYNCPNIPYDEKFPSESDLE
jgi:hypothetical protein